MYSPWYTNGSLDHHLPNLQKVTRKLKKLLISYDKLPKVKKGYRTVTKKLPKNSEKLLKSYQKLTQSSEKKLPKVTEKLPKRL
jgi:uncharacterized protein (DUF885 family)